MDPITDKLFDIYHNFIASLTRLNLRYDSDTWESFYKINPIYYRNDI